MTTEQDSKRHKELQVSQVHGNTYPGASAKASEVVCQRLSSIWAFWIIQPSLWTENERIWEYIWIGVHMVGVHTNCRPRWDDPLSVLHGVQSVDSWAPLRRTIAQTQTCI